MTAPRMADGAKTFTERDFTRKDSALVERWRKRLYGLGHLYRYVSLEGRRLGWFEDVVLRCKLQFSGFRGFNDPFDGAVELDYSGTEQEIRTFWTEHLRERGVPLDDAARARIDYFVAGAIDPAVHRELRAAYAAEVAQLGVVCMSEPPDDLPMWGYYADSHRGACLRFGWPDQFIPQGPFVALAERFGLTAPAIAERIGREMKR